MSILGSIGKGLLGAIPVIGPALSTLSSGAAQGRVQEAGANSNYDQNKLRAAQLLEQALQGRAGLDLQQRQFQLQAPQQRAGNSVRGDTLANLQDAQITGPITGTKGQIPQLTGGLRPSLLSGNSRQLGQSMSRDALLGQMKGDAFNPMPPVNIPEITPLPQAGAMSKIAGGLGIAGGLLGALGAGSDDEDTLLGKYGTKRPPIPGTNGGF